MISDDEARFVKPFYLKMMGLNAAHEHLSTERDLLIAAQQAARDVDIETVVTFLRGEWRPRVMGAWLSVAQDPSEVREELLTSLATSSGSLTAPPLAAAAAYLFGVEAVPSLVAYRDGDAGRRDGSWTFVNEVVRRLDADHAQQTGDPLMEPYVERMLNVAAHLANR